MGKELSKALIKEVCDFVDYRGATPKKSEIGVFLVTAKNIQMGSIDYNISKEYIPKENYEKVMRRGLPKLGDILFTSEAPMGNVAIVDRDDIALAQRVIKLRTKKKNLYNKYLFYYMQSYFFQKELIRYSTGSTVKGIKNKTLRKMIVFFPSLQEQKQIADILSIWDYAIKLKEEEENKTQELLTKYIKEFYVKNENMIALKYFIKKENKIYKVDNRYLEIGDVDVTNRTYSIGDKEPVKGAKKAEYGTILVSKVRPTRGAIIMLNHNMYVSSGFSQLKVKQDFNPKYIYYGLLTNKFSYIMGSLSTGSTYPTIKDDDVLSYKIPFREKSKQDEIVDTLEVIDKKIRLLTKEIEQLKLQKKGLMQRLLTGKIRVQT